MKFWIRNEYGNFVRFSCYQLMSKPTFTTEEIFYLIETSNTLTELAKISAVLQTETDRYSYQELDAFHILLEAKKDIILNNDTLPQKE